MELSGDSNNASINRDSVITRGLSGLLASVNAAAGASIDDYEGELFVKTQA